MNLFVQGTAERPNHGQGRCRRRQGGKQEAEPAIGGQMQELVVGKGHAFDAFLGKKGGAKNGRKVKPGKHEVFPSQIGHGKGSLGAVEHRAT